MQNILFVGAGGFVGSVARYLLSGLVHRAAPFLIFPIGTLAVNVLGCFTIGFFSGLNNSFNIFSVEARLFFFIGLLGGFTTFSTFGYETMALLKDAEGMKALLNILLNITLCISSVWAGNIFSKLL